MAGAAHPGHPGYPDQLATARPARSTVLSGRRPHLGQVFIAALALLVAVAAAASMRDAVLGPGPGLGLGSRHLGALITGSGHVLWLDPDGPARHAGLSDVSGGAISALGGEAMTGYRLAAFDRHERAGLLAVSAGSAGSFHLFFIQPAAPSSTELAGDVTVVATAALLWFSALIAGLFPRREQWLQWPQWYALAALCIALSLVSLPMLDAPMLWPRLAAMPAAAAGLALLVAASARLGSFTPRWMTALALACAAPAAGLSVASVFTPLPGITGAVIIALLAILALAALTILVLAHTATASEPRRRAIRIAFAAMTAGLGPLCVWPGAAFVALYRGRGASTPLPSHASPLWYCGGLALTALIYASLLSSANLRRLDARIRLAASYVAALVIALGIAALVVPRVPVAAAVVAVAVLVIVLPPLQAGLLRLVDRVLARIGPDYARALRVVEEITAAAATPMDLATSVIAHVTAPLAVPDAALLVRGLACPTTSYRLFAAHADAAGRVVSLDPALEAREPREARPRAWHDLNLDLDLDTLAPESWLAVGQEPAIWAPLWWNGAQCGALVLAGRSDGDPFAPEDLDQIAALTGLLALALAAKQLVDSLHERTQALVNLTHRLSHAHEQERAHLSRELHDVVAQELIALTRQLRRYGEAGAAPPPAIWADMLAGAQDALTATRRICNGLRPAILDLGLTPALRDLVSAAAESGSAPAVSFTMEGAERRLSAELEFALFRVAQEGVNNAVAHARARQVRVEVAFDGNVAVRVRDDGRGFAVPARFEDLPGDHLGLIGMRERLAEFGGTITVTSQAGRGTILEASVPAPE